MSNIDSRWEYSKDGETIKSLIISLKGIDRKPSKAAIKEHIKKVTGRYLDHSMFGQFNPELVIGYKYLYGWETGYNLVCYPVSNAKVPTKYFDQIGSMTVTKI